MASIAKNLKKIPAKKRRKYFAGTETMSHAKSYDAQQMKNRQELEKMGGVKRAAYRKKKG